MKSNGHESRGVAAVLHTVIQGSRLQRLCYLQHLVILGTNIQVAEGGGEDGTWKILWSGFRGDTIISAHIPLERISQMVISNCRGGWEIASNYVSMKKRKHQVNSKPSVSAKVRATNSNGHSKNSREPYEEQWT